MMERDGRLVLVCCYCVVPSILRMVQCGLESDRHEMFDFVPILSGGQSFCIERGYAVLCWTVRTALYCIAMCCICAV